MLSFGHTKEMLSQNTSQMLLSKLEVPLCDIFKCAEKDCLSSDVKKYVEAQYYRKDNPILSISSFNSEEKKKQDSWKRPVSIMNSNCTIFDSNNLHYSSLNAGNHIQSSPVCFRKLEVRLHDILKNSNKNLDLSSLANEISKSEQNSFTGTRKSPRLKINSKSEGRSLLEITSESESSSVNEEGSEWEKGSEIESDDDEGDIDYFPDSKKDRSKKKKLLTKKPTVSKRVKIKKKKLMNENKELTDYEKLIQKSREEKMAFLKSLQIDEIKEDIKKTKSHKKRPSNNKLKNCEKLPERKSSRILTLKNVNLAEDFIINKAYSEASKEQDKQIEAQRRRLIKIEEARAKTDCTIDSNSEEEIDGNSNASPTKIILIDFLISALNDKCYGNLFKWRMKGNYHFGIRWSRFNFLFQDYDKLRGRYHPEVKGYHQQALERFHALLRKCSFIKFVRRERFLEIYQFCLNADVVEKESLEHLKKRLESNYICGKTFCEEYDFTRHFFVPMNGFPILCKVCGKKFITNSELDKHRFAHTVGASDQSNAS